MDLQLRTPPQPSTRRHPRRRRRWPLYTGVVLLILAGVAALGLRTAVGARNRLTEGRDALEQARTALLDGDATSAAAAFADAEVAFRLASDLTATPILRAARWVPLVRHTPEAVTAMADAGVLIARAGRQVTEEVTRLPGGLEALGPTAGGFDPAPFARLAPTLREAAGLVHDAVERVESIPTTLVPAPVLEARRDALDELGTLDRLLATSGDLFDDLPTLLGSERPARYFVAAQNPAEIRGTGGLMGAYSVLTVRDGRFSFDPFLQIQSLPTFRPGQVEAPNDDYARNYNAFGGAGFWLNVNMTPDFPSAAQAILTSYEKATGQALDGVIAADPRALEGLVRQAGAVEVPSLGVTLGARNVADFVTNDAYRRFSDQGTRKAVLGDVAEQVFARFMRGGGSDPIASMEALARIAGGGHVKLYSTDPDAQAALMQAGVAGSLEAEGDLLAVVQNNGGANKVDFYLDRSVSHTVRLMPGGGAEATTRIHLENHAPASGEPQYVIGPFKQISEAGENVSFVSVFCDDTCRLRRAERDGERVAVTAGEELGRRFFQDYLAIPSRSSADLAFDLTIADAWDGGRGEGRYVLSFLTQPSHRPTKARIEIQVPEGMLALAAGGGARIEGDRVIWEGIPDATTTLEVEFGRPMSSGLARHLVPLLERPVVRL